MCSLRKRHAGIKRRFVDVMMLVASSKSKHMNCLERTSLNVPENTNPARWKHQRQRELHGVSQPSLDKSPQKMAMGHEDNIRWSGLTVHVILLNGLDFLDQIVQSVCYLLCRPEILCNRSISPHCLAFTRNCGPKTHSPSSHPSRQISQGLSPSSPCSFLSARIWLVTIPSYCP